MNQSIFEQTAGCESRLLYFDPLPDACIHVLDAAADLQIAVQTVSHPSALEDICQTFQPTGLMLVLRPAETDLVRILGRLAAAGVHAPMLVAGEPDISLDRDLEQAVRELGVDLRGSVRLGGELRDLQLALLSAAAILGRNFRARS